LTKKIATLESRRAALLGGGADAIADEKAKVRVICVRNVAQRSS
jgi:hypothetical protein